MSLPEQYQWLAKEGAPKMIVEALNLFGTIETPGNASNPVILEWAKELGLSTLYNADEIPWCGLFMAIVAKHAGKTVVPNPLWALGWSVFGNYQKEPMLGDVLVFRRGGGGHVALYVGEDDTAYHTLGGNQSDCVCITRMAKARLYAVRRPVYSIAQPANVRKIVLNAAGALSTNEA
jgi:uncharacterized protein (TIGR02594 family)